MSGQNAGTLQNNMTPRTTGGSLLNQPGFGASTGRPTYSNPAGLDSGANGGGYGSYSATGTTGAGVDMSGRPPIMPTGGMTPAPGNGMSTTMPVGAQTAMPTGGTLPTGGGDPNYGTFSGAPAPSIGALPRMPVGAQTPMPTGGMFSGVPNLAQGSLGTNARGSFGRGRDPNRPVASADPRAAWGASHGGPPGQYYSPRLAGGMRQLPQPPGGPNDPMYNDPSVRPRGVPQTYQYDPQSQMWLPPEALAQVQSMYADQKANADQLKFWQTSLDPSRIDGYDLAQWSPQQLQAGLSYYQQLQSQAVPNSNEWRMYQDRINSIQNNMNGNRGAWDWSLTNAPSYFQTIQERSGSK